MTIDWTTVLVAAITGLLSGSAISAIIIAVWRGLEARARSKRADAREHIEAADDISQISTRQIKQTIAQYEARIALYDERLVTLEEKCHRYEMAFETMREDLIQARQTITQLESTNSGLLGRVRHLEEENAELQKSVKALKDENTNLRRRLDAVNKRMENGEHGGKHD